MELLQSRLALRMFSGVFQQRDGFRVESPIAPELRGCQPTFNRFLWLFCLEPVLSQDSQVGLRHHSQGVGHGGVEQAPAHL